MKYIINFNVSDIPGIVGIIDSTHINIKASPHNANDYYNRNNMHSVKLQAVCDDKKIHRVFIGTPGRVMLPGFSELAFHLIYSKLPTSNFCC